VPGDPREGDRIVVQTVLCHLIRAGGQKECVEPGFATDLGCEQVDQAVQIVQEVGQTQLTLDADAAPHLDSPLQHGPNVHLGLTRATA